METVKLYDNMPYGEDFTARVLEIEEGDKEGRIAVILDQTLFFPLEGGQNPDTGLINDYRVNYVTIKDNVIRHFIELKEGEEISLRPGEEVKASIDFAHRFDLMQQHSGEHILSGILYRDYGYTNVGFHLTEDIVTLDTSGPLSEEEVLKLEMEANEVLFMNVPIVARYPSEEELSNMTYRSKIELKGPVRIVTVEGFDQCACCAPHVRHTGEVGAIRIVSAINYKGGMRLEIKCGKRAYLFDRDNRRRLDTLARGFSTKPENVPTAVYKIKCDLAASNEESRKRLEKYFEFLKETIKYSNDSIIHIENDLTLQGKELEDYVKSLSMCTDSYALVLIPSQNGNFRYCAGSAHKDLKPLQEALKKNFAAKGGGRDFIQGSLAGNFDEIKKVVKGV